MTRFALLMLTVFLCGVTTVYADVGTGADLYDAKGCSDCHTLAGEGGAVGPELTAAGTVPGHDHDWQVRHLLDPAGVVAGSTMPPLMQDPAEAAHLADFLMSLDGSQAAPAEAAVPAEAPFVAPPKVVPPEVSSPSNAQANTPQAAPVTLAEVAEPTPAKVVAAADGLSGNSVEGEALYQARGCPLCHTDSHEPY